MTRMLINNLEFCEQLGSQEEQVEGGFFSFSFDFIGDFDFSPAGSAAAGSGVAIAVGIGEDNQVFTLTTDE